MHNPTAHIGLVIAFLTAVGCDPPRSPGAMIKTTMRFRVDDARSVSVVEADGPSDHLKQACLNEIRQAVAGGNVVGEDVGGGVREFACFDYYPR